MKTPIGSHTKLKAKSIGRSSRDRSIIWLPLFGFLTFLLCAATLNAQLTGGIIRGIVTDPSGAPLSNAQVTATNVGTAVSTSTYTNDTGLYVFPTLIPGTYNVTISAPGFATHVNQGIMLLIQQSLQVDVKMGVGAVTDTVNVSGTPTLLDTETATNSALISGELVQDLPLFGRNPLMVNRLVAGANPTSTTDVFSRPVDSFEAGDIVINGAPTESQSFLIDGVSDVYGAGAPGFLPPTYAVREVRVQTFALDAEYGQTGGSVTTLETKSGENKLHGNLWFYHHDQGLDANTFFNDRFGQPKSVTHDNQFGGTIGGPIYIPGIYNGTGRTFFFADVELTRNITNSTALLTVPTQRERNGDFSQTFTSDGQLIQIFNPFSLHPDPVTGAPVRDPFPGNIIPSSMISPIATNLLKAVVPLPNLPGTFNNFFFSQDWPYISNSVHFRIDHHIGQKDWLFGSFGYIKDVESYPGLLPSGVQGYINEHPGFIIALGYGHTFGPTRTLDLRIGVHRDHQNLPPITANKYIDQLGLPASLTDTQVSKNFPIFNATGIGYYVGDDPQGTSFITPDWRAYLTQIIRRHTLKVGYEGRVYRTFSYSQYGESGNFSFAPYWTQGPSPNVPSTTAGIDIAELLLGTPVAGSISTNASNASQSTYHALYLQDDWRATSRLTLNLGLRWDIETATTERFNKANRGFDFTSPSPIGDQVNANLAANPVPGISHLNLVGGLLFAGVAGQPRGVENQGDGNFMPRVGATFQLNAKTVMRGGYGIFFPQLTDYTFGQVYQAQLPMTQLGFSSSTQMVVSSPSGLPLDTLNNPFPNGQVPPIGSSLGLATLLGQSISPNDVNYQRPRVQQFQFGFERQLLRDLAVTVAYAGSRTDHLQVTQDVNPIPEKYVTDPALSPGGVFAQVSNPFFGIIPVGALSLPTVSLPQLLRPYPQFTGVTIAQRPFGTNWYNGLQVNASKRVSYGVSFMANYTWSKDMTKNTYLDPYHPLVNDISPFDRPQVFVVGGRWELPVGRGRRFGHDLPFALEHAVGGWNVSWITTFMDGLPTGPWSGAIQTHAPGHVDQNIDRWFDTTAFAPLPAYTLPSLLPYSSQIRSPGSKNFNFTVAKTFPIREKFHFDVAINLYNAFNTPIFASPDITVLDPAFGTITSQANSSRVIFLNGVLSF